MWSLPSVPVTACGVVSVDAVSGVNRVFGSIPPGGTSGIAELDAAGEVAEAGVAVGAAGAHPLAPKRAVAKTTSAVPRLRIPARRDDVGVRATGRQSGRTPPPSDAGSSGPRDLGRVL